MRQALIVYFLFGLFLWQGCTHNSATHKTLTYNIDLTKNITYPFSEFMSVSRVVHLETDRNSLLKGIERIRVTDDYIFIFSNREVVKVFSHDGKYLYDIGKKGKGPEELLMATDFDISPDMKEVAIWDRNRSELKLYKINGDFIKSIKSQKIQWVFRVCWLKQNRFLLSSLNRPHEDKRYQIYLLDESLNVIKGMIPYDEKLDFWTITGPVFVKDSEGTVHFRHPFGTEIYEVTNDAHKKYSLNFGQHQLNNSDKERFAKNSKLLFTSPKAIVIRYQETDKYIYCRHQFENRNYSLLINKDTKEQKRYNHSNPFDYSVFISIVGVYKNSFVGLINPYKLREKLSKINKSDEVKHKAGIEYWKNIAKDTEDTDNPIIVFLNPEK